jgi:hypothetical protein
MPMYLGSATRSVIGFLFLLSSMSKLMRGVPSFGDVISRYRLTPVRLSLLLAWVVVVVELMLAVALIVGLAVPFAGLLAAGILAMFVFAVTINLLRGETALTCGCFGSPDTKISWRLVARNLVLIALSVVSADAPSVVATKGAHLRLTEFAAAEAIAAGTMAIFLVSRVVGRLISDASSPQVEESHSS